MKLIKKAMITITLCIGVLLSIYVIFIYFFLRELPPIKTYYFDIKYEQLSVKLDSIIRYNGYKCIRKKGKSHDVFYYELFLNDNQSYLMYLLEESPGCFSTSKPSIELYNCFDNHKNMTISSRNSDDYLDYVEKFEEKVINQLVGN